MAMGHFRELNFQHNIYQAPNQENSIEDDLEIINLPYNPYRNNDVSPYEKLEIEIESNKIMRFSCAALRHAFALHSEFSQILTSIALLCEIQKNFNRLISFV